MAGERGDAYVLQKVVEMSGVEHYKIAYSEENPGSWTSGQVAALFPQAGGSLSGPAQIVWIP